MPGTRTSRPVRGRPVTRVNALVPTSTVVTRSAGPSPSVFGQSVTFTATVSSGSGTPTGTVQFKDGAANLGAPVALVAGVAELEHGGVGGGCAFDHGGVLGERERSRRARRRRWRRRVNQAATTTAITGRTRPDPSNVGSGVHVQWYGVGDGAGCGNAHGERDGVKDGAASLQRGGMAAGQCALTSTTSRACRRSPRPTRVTRTSTSAVAGTTGHTVNAPAPSRRSRWT